MKKIKTVLAITTIGLVGVSFANAQSTTTPSVKQNTKSNFMQMFKQKHRNHKMGHKIDKQKVNEAIIAGDYATFQILASTTPLAKLDQNSFNLLKAPMLAKKTAQENIKAILQAAGIALKVPATQ